MNEPKEKKNEKKETAEKKAPQGPKLAIIRVRGGINVNTDIKDTLNMLNLRNQNACCVLADTPSVRGMIGKVNNHVTWGEVDEETEKLLREKRGIEGRKFYRLSPPRKGFGRRGIKRSFTRSGALGYRGEKINDLIRRMI